MFLSDRGQFRLSYLGFKYYAKNLLFMALCSRCFIGHYIVTSIHAFVVTFIHACVVVNVKQ